MRGLPIFETGVQRSMVMMKHLVCSLSLLALLSGCSEEESTSTETADTGTPVATEITVSSDITADTTWASGSIVTLSALIVVTGNATMRVSSACSRATSNCRGRRMNGWDSFMAGVRVRLRRVPAPLPDRYSLRKTWITSTLCPNRGRV